MEIVLPVVTLLIRKGGCCLFSSLAHNSTFELCDVSTYLPKMHLGHVTHLSLLVFMDFY